MRTYCSINSDDEGKGQCGENVRSAVPFLLNAFIGVVNEIVKTIGDAMRQRSRADPPVTSALFADHLLANQFVAKYIIPV